MPHSLAHRAGPSFDCQALSIRGTMTEGRKGRLWEPKMHAVRFMDRVLGPLAACLNMAAVGDPLVIFKLKARRHPEANGTN